MRLERDLELLLPRVGSSLLSDEMSCTNTISRWLDAEPLQAVLNGAAHAVGRIVEYDVVGRR